MLSEIIKAVAIISPLIVVIKTNSITFLDTRCMHSAILQKMRIGSCEKNGDSSLYFELYNNFVQYYYCLKLLGEKGGAIIIETFPIDPALIYCL